MLQQVNERLSMGLKNISTYSLGRVISGSTKTASVSLNICQGSVLDFFAIDKKSDRVGAIVNAANEGCLYGGGVDGAINEAGGPQLWKDRKALPVIKGTEKKSAPCIRCATGSAVITGPNDYGELHVPFVVHAVGPAYLRFDEEGFSRPDALLRSAYHASLERCHENGITDVAFSLLSAGIFRGERSLHDVLTIAVMAIQEWVDTKTGQTMEAASDSSDGDSNNELFCSSHRLKSITLCAFSTREVLVLKRVCQGIFEANDTAGDKDEDEKDEMKETASEVENNEKQQIVANEATKKPQTAVGE
mmetsp:Transcript_17604/g.48663  ORF Transcript_17604/g.48663 Transcript_17604/m.48663 type:complete len:304 (-) Transcript_17604:5633-6544(-)